MYGGPWCGPYALRCLDVMWRQWDAYYAPHLRPGSLADLLAAVVDQVVATSTAHFAAKEAGQLSMFDASSGMQQAISLPNFGSRNGPTEIEQGRVSEAVIDQLKAQGHNVRVMEQNSGLQGIMRIRIHGDEMWFGGADPRREGIVEGD